MAPRKQHANGASYSIYSSRKGQAQSIRARNGEITGLTGVDDPYEDPIKPDLVVELASRLSATLSTKSSCFLRASAFWTLFRSTCF